MDRRDTLKLIAWSTVSTSLLVGACKEEDKKVNVPKEKASAFNYDRMEEEKIHDEKLLASEFFTSHELATIAVLADFIIPRDEISGSATDAKVPDFIEFMVKDKPELQTPMRGGLHWVDMQMNKAYGKPFKDCTAQQQVALLDKIAYPNKVSAAMKPGGHFFTLMRNLTASGFYSSKIGIEDVGYVGNKANQWNGVPDEVLKQYNIAYTEKELKECVKFT